MKKSTKNQSITERYTCGKCGAVDKNVERLCCLEIESVEYFELLDMRYGSGHSKSLKMPVK